MEYRTGWMTASVERDLFAIAGEGHARWLSEHRREIGKHGKCVRGTIFISDEGMKRLEMTQTDRVLVGAKVLARAYAGLDLDSLPPVGRNHTISHIAKILDATDGLHPAVARVAELEKQLSESANKINQALTDDLLRALAETLGSSYEQVSRAYNDGRLLTEEEFGRLFTRATSNQIARLNDALALARTKVSPDHPVQKEIDAILNCGAA